MKKAILTITLILCFVNANSQINNLRDFLEVSELSVYGLTANLQYNWKVEMPTENYSSDNTKVIGKYSFTNENSNQKLQRIVITDVSTGNTIENTNLICNDLALLNRITKNLAYNGFNLKSKQENKTTYDDGNYIFIIQHNYSQKQFGKGYYKLSISYK